MEDIVESETDENSEERSENEYEMPEEEANAALHRAAEYGTVELVSFLLRSGWDIHINSLCEMPDGAYGHIETPLLAAMSGGDADIVSLLLQNGSIPDYRPGNSSQTALEYAAAFGLPDLADILLHYGADVKKPTRLSSREFDLRSSDKAQAIHVAALRGHVNMVRLLLQHGAQIDNLSEGGLTPLHVASIGGKLHVVRSNRSALCLSSTACPRSKVSHRKGADVRTGDKWKLTPLRHFFTSNSKEIEVVAELIQHGSSVTDISNYGEPIIHMALGERASLELANLLHKHGADIHARDECGGTLLHLIRAWPLKEALGLTEYLIKNGADVLAKDSKGLLPIHKWARRRHWDSDRELTALIEMSPDSNMINRADNDGVTPLHEAVYFHALASVRLLLARGANVNAICAKGHTPLQWLTNTERAYDEDDAEIAEILINNGANVNATDAEGKTPLYHASKQSRFSRGNDVLDVLVRHSGIDHEHGSMSLHRAAFLGSAVAISCLIESGADVNATDNDGFTALYHATRYSIDTRVEKVFKVLLDNGADVSIAPPDFPLLPLHLVSKDRTPPASVIWMLLKAENLSWLEPSCTRPPVSQYPADNQREYMRKISKMAPKRQNLFLTEVLPETTELQGLSEETMAQSVSRKIWEKITWQFSGYVNPESRLRLKVYEKWKASRSWLQESRDLLLNQLPGGALLYFRLIIEIGAAYNPSRLDSLKDSVMSQLRLLEQMAVTDMLEHHNELSSNDIWSLVRQSFEDANMRRLVYSGRYFGRWRRFMTDILRTRNIEIRVARALERLPPELIIRISEMVLDLEEIPRKSEWRDIWGGEENPKRLLDPDVEGDDSFCATPRDDLYHNGSVVFDPISRKFAWVWKQFVGAVYYGFEPTFLYDRTQRRWIVNERHLSRFGGLYSNKWVVQVTGAEVDEDEDEDYFNF